MKTKLISSFLLFSLVIGILINISPVHAIFTVASNVGTSNTAMQTFRSGYNSGCNDIQIHMFCGYSMAINSTQAFTPITAQLRLSRANTATVVTCVLYVGIWFSNNQSLTSGIPSPVQSQQAISNPFDCSGSNISVSNTIYTFTFPGVQPTFNNNTIYHFVTWLSTYTSSPVNQMQILIDSSSNNRANAGVQSCLQGTPGPLAWIHLQNTLGDYCSTTPNSNGFNMYFQLNGLAITSGGSGGGNTNGSNSYLFFDDFASADAYPPKWSSYSAATQKLVHQNGGRVFLTVADFVDFDLVTGQLQQYNALISNSTDPIISSATSEGQYVFMTWKLTASNMTQDTLTRFNGGNNSITWRVYNSYFGLTDALASLNFLGFKVTHVDNIDKPHSFGQRTSVSAIINFNRPNCYSDSRNICNNSEIVLTSQSMTFSDSEHFFTIQMRLFPITHASWIDFEIDNDMQFNITQNQCLCIDNPSASTVSVYPSMHPMFFNIICLPGTPTAQNCFNAYPQTISTPPRHIAMSVDYVLIANYRPVSLPAGSPLFWDLGAPKNPLNSDTPDLQNILQYAAYSLSSGNLGFGGTLISMVFIILALFALVWSGVRFPFIYTLTTLAITLICVSFNILGLWIGIVAIVVALSGSMVFNLSLRRNRV